MEFNDVITMITNVGFPIVCVLLLAYYIREITVQHKEEVDSLSKNLNTMCLSIQTLTDKIDELIRKDKDE